MMAEARGKGFEAEFSRSLKALPGFGFRLLDGGPNVRIKQPGDFIYCGAITWLIECKTTKQRSFPFRNIQPHQIESLMCWEQADTFSDALAKRNDRYMEYLLENDERGRLSLVAIRYETYGRMFLCPIRDIVNEMETAKSMSVERASQVGIECKKQNGVWLLGLP